ncbi:MAG: hypothetical protein H6873_05595 [Hyphomicrobiaceae bacterium]|nr:hypothetical protein [Hyphomicrobiaceae bacterium]
MAGITIDQAQSHLDLWLAADEAVATGQEFEIETANGGRRKLRRADAAEIRNRIDYWNGKVEQLTRQAQGRTGVRYVVR